MKIDVSKFFDLKEVDWRKTCNGMIEYDIILINKVSKEEYVIALLDEDFDELLRDMEEELMSTQINYYLCRRYSFFIPQHAWAYKMRWEVPKLDWRYTVPYSYTFKI